MADSKVKLSTGATWGLLHKKALAEARKTQVGGALSKWLAGDPKENIKFVNTGIGGTDDNPEFLGCNQEYRMSLILPMGTGIKGFFSKGILKKYAKQFMETYLSFFCGVEGMMDKAEVAQKKTENVIEAEIIYTIEDSKSAPNLKAIEDAIAELKQTIEKNGEKNGEKKGGEEDEKDAGKEGSAKDASSGTSDNPGGMKDDDDVIAASQNPPRGKLVAESAWGNESPFESLWAENRQRKLERNMALVNEMVSGSKSAKDSLETLIAEKVEKRLGKIQK